VLNSHSEATIVFRNNYRRYSTLILGVLNSLSLLVNELIFSHKDLQNQNPTSGLRNWASAVLEVR
jgi:hypothetical protein